MKARALITLVPIGVPVCFALMATSAAAQFDPAVRKPSLISFSVPGAGSGLFQGTFPTGINDSFTVTGYYTDDNKVSHGFISQAGAKFVTFDVPSDGGGTRPGTFPQAINSAGNVVGYFVDSTGDHGFLRTPDGNFTLINYPGTNSGAAARINSQGVIAGGYIDLAGDAHGMIRSPEGTYVSFDVPGLVPGPEAGPAVYGINTEGAVVGVAYDPNVESSVSFVRHPDGTVAIIEVPGYAITYATGIDDRGVATGSFADIDSGFSGFQLSRNGVFTYFDVSVGGHSFGTSTYAGNRFGTVVGLFYTIGAHGFIRNTNGAVIPFNGPDQDALAPETIAINSFGAVTGSYVTTSLAYDGFLWIP